MKTWTTATSAHLLSILTNVVFILLVSGVVDIDASIQQRSDQLKGQVPDRPPDTRVPRVLANAPPFPFSEERDQIVSNVVWGLQSTRMDNELLDLIQRGLVSVARLISVQGAQVGRYFLLEMDTRDGRASRDVLVGHDGYLMSIGGLSQGYRKGKPLDLAAVSNELSRRFGATNVMYFHAGNNIEGGGGSLYLPLIKATTGSGALIVNSKREIYVVGAKERFQGRVDEATRDLGQRRQGQFWLVDTDGVSMLSKIGDLSN